MGGDSVDGSRYITWVCFRGSVDRGGDATAFFLLSFKGQRGLAALPGLCFSSPSEEAGFRTAGMLYVM